MATLHLKNMVCRETEDNTGADECELRLWCDSKYYSFRHDMNNGDDWTIDIRLPFSRRAKIQLFDLDAGTWYDRHDHLGTNILRPDRVDGGEVTFNQDGADYSLYFDVI